VARIVDAMSGIPACALNLARFAFLAPRSRALWVDWETALRTPWPSRALRQARNPYDRALTDVIGQLSAREEFRVR
jgi:hypothetical protein